MLDLDAAGVETGEPRARFGCVAGEVFERGLNRHRCGAVRGMGRIRITVTWSNWRVEAEVQCPACEEEGDMAMVGPWDKAGKGQTWDFAIVNSG